MIFCSQSIESQVAMVQKVKAHKAGFVTSGANIKPEAPLQAVLSLMNESGHSTIPVTDDGTSEGMFLGLITDQDFWEFEDDLTNLVSEHMTPKSEVIFLVLLLGDADPLVNTLLGLFGQVFIILGTEQQGVGAADVDAVLGVG